MRRASRRPRPDLATPCAGSCKRCDLGHIPKGRRLGPSGCPYVHSELPETKGGICVSTVSIVGGCRDLLDPGWPNQSDSSRCRWHWRVASSCTYVTVFTDFFAPQIEKLQP